MNKKTLWARNGALIGVAIVLSDYFLMWRGPKYLPWSDVNAISNNVGQMVGVIGFAALIGLVAGAITDRQRKKVL